MTQQEWNNNQGGEEDPQALGGDSAASEGGGSGRKLNFNTSTLTLVMAFATAVVMLYLLGLHNKPKAATAGEIQKKSQQEALINEMLNNGDAQKNVKDLFKGTEALITMLDGYFNRVAKPLVLNDNPFEHPEPTIADDGSKSSATEPSTPAVDPRLHELSEEFNTFKVQTVMMGNPPAAIVSDQMVTPGSALGSFTVIEIKSDHLVLGWQDKKFTLKVGGAQMNKH